MNETKNYGVLLGDSPDTYRADRVGGALPYIVRQKDGDWTSHLPPEERQYNDSGDSMSCVSFAHLSGIETQEFSWLQKLNIPNSFEYSDRWIAKMSDTTKEGNYLWKVADTIRKYGLVKEESYPRPEGSWTWEQYHADIPEPLLSKLLAEGQEWLKKWDVKYESVDVSKESLMRHLKMAPLTVVIPGHAILNFLTTEQLVHYFDTYPPHKKTTSAVIQAMKVMLYPKEQAVSDDALLVDVKYLDSGRQVEKLRNALIRNGWIEAEQLPNSYDNTMANLVFKFQKANLNRLSWEYFWAVFYYKGKLVGPGMREILNKNL